MILKSSITLVYWIVQFLVRQCSIFEIVLKFSEHQIKLFDSTFQRYTDN